MRITKAIFSAIIPMSALLMACNEPDGVSKPDETPGTVSNHPESAMQKKYAESVLALKKEISDPRLLSEKVIELRSSYPFVESEPSEAERIAAEAYTMEALESIGVYSANGGRPDLPLRKSAAYSKTLVKDYATNVRKTYVGSTTLNRFATLTVTANAIGSADPFVVLYSRHYIPGSYGHLTIHNYDDDGAGGLSSRVSYTNNSQWSTPITVYYIVFSANAEGGIGNVNLVVNKDGEITNINNVPARGVGAVSNNAGTAPCTTPGKSEIVVSGGNGNYFAMDASRMHGAMNEAYNNAWWIPDMNRTGTPNFVISFVPPYSEEFLGNLKQYDECF